MPSVAEMSTATSAMTTETRVPATVRLSRSRPRLSVPSAFSQVPPANTGGLSRNAGLALVGLAGSHAAGQSVTTASTTMITIPVVARRSRRSSFQKRLTSTP